MFCASVLSAQTVPCVPHRTTETALSQTPQWRSRDRRHRPGTSGKKPRLLGQACLKSRLKRENVGCHSSGEVADLHLHAPSIGCLSRAIHIPSMVRLLPGNLGAFLPPVNPAGAQSLRGRVQVKENLMKLFLTFFRISFSSFPSDSIKQLRVRTR